MSGYFYVAESFGGYDRFFHSTELDILGSIVNGKTQYQIQDLKDRFLRLHNFFSPNAALYMRLDIECSPHDCSMKEWFNDEEEMKREKASHLLYHKFVMY